MQHEDFSYNQDVSGEHDPALAQSEHEAGARRVFAQTELKRDILLDRCSVQTASEVCIFLE